MMTTEQISGDVGDRFLFLKFFVYLAIFLSSIHEYIYIASQHLQILVKTAFAFPLFDTQARRRCSSTPSC